MFKSINRIRMLIGAGLLAVISMLTIRCNENQTPIEPEPSVFKEITLTPQEESAIQSSNTFAFNIFDKINASENEKNIMISPLSISYALSMLLNGAEGETQQEIIDVLNQSDLTVEEINNAFKVLTNDLLTVDKKINMGIANSVWTKQGYNAKQSFINTLQEYYSAQVKSLTSAAEINSWVNTNTKGMIPQIMDELNPQLIMLLINAIYFEGEWSSGFDENDTREETFYISQSKSVQTKMMRQTSSFKYYNNENFSIAELPYGQGNYVMDIILPSDTKTIDEVMPEINNDVFLSVSERPYPKSVFVVLPRFKYSYNKNLNDILVSLGMPLAFSDMADFSGMMDTSLRVSKIDHASFIETTEKGSRAAAVTSVAMEATSVGPSTTIQFIVNKPFAYVIRECSTNTIVFMGKVINPLLNN